MRYLSTMIGKFSEAKFVFIAGPRQVGKTTLAKAWGGTEGRYLSWDIAEDRAQLLSKTFVRELSNGRYVFDEIHKYPRWKALLKGLYDARHHELTALVTGSARLDVYQRGGDSLLGRYELLHLHPFSVGEIIHGEIRPPPPPEGWLTIGLADARGPDVWARLARTSGFPEPYHLDDPLQYNRWSSRRRDLLIREDVRDLTQIRNLAVLEQMALLLPNKVGSPFSLNKLRQDLEISHDTAKTWLEVLTGLYFCYAIKPFVIKLARSLKKEPKVYLWDWTSVSDPAARFENMVAGHLLKSVQTWRDLGYGDYDLCYWRDQQKRELDFVVTLNRMPIALVECKMSDGDVSPNFRIAEALLGLDLPKIQVVNAEGIDRLVGKTRVVSASRFFAGLI